jgi:hypothetical protein
VNECLSTDTHGSGPRSSGVRGRKCGWTYTMNTVPVTVCEMVNEYGCVPKRLNVQWSDDVN